MKKIILIGLFGFLTTASFAAQMQFVTLLSQPVGSFAKVELPNDGTAEIFHLNFCNTGTEVGFIDLANSFSAHHLKAANSAWRSNIAQYNLTGGAAVSATGDMQVKNMEISGELKFSDTTPYLKVDGTLNNSGTAQTLTADVASFDTMQIPGVAWLKAPATSAVLRNNFLWRDVNPVACASDGVTKAADCKADLLVNVDREAGSSCPNGTRADGTCKVLVETWGWVKVTPHTANVKQLCNVTTGYTLVGYSCAATNAEVRPTRGGASWMCDWELTTYSGRCGMVSCNADRNGDYCIQAQTPTDQGNGICSYPLYQCGLTASEWK